MSKRKGKLELNKFYIAYGGNSHPAKIYEKTAIGTYKSIKTGTTPSKDMVKIKPIQKGYMSSYVHKRPFEGTKKDYGDKELLGLKFDPSDNKTLEEIKQRKSKLTKSAKKAYKKMPSSD